MAKSKVPEDSNAWVVSIAQHAERHRTIRLLIVVAGFSACVWAVSWAAVKIFDTSWPKAVALIAMAMLPTTLVAGFRNWIIGQFQSYIKKNGERMADLERKADQNRSTSGLNRDGSDPNKEV